MSRFQQLAMSDNLKTLVESLKWQPKSKGTEWGEILHFLKLFRRSDAK